MLHLLPPPVAALLEPFHFMGIAVSYLPSTLLSLIHTRDFGTLLSWPRLRAAWFGRFWARAGPEVRAVAEKKVIPLVQGRVGAGHIHPPPSDTDSDTDTDTTTHSNPPHPPVSGTVLEIGPGSGMWTSLFSSRHLPRVTKVYGVEPNPAQHGALRRRVADTGLDTDGTYEIVAVGIEDLAASGHVPCGSVDCVVTVMCLCSIPDPERNIRELYGFLRPGGRWYVYEHVRCFGWQGWGMGLYQGELETVALE
ncbi:S-adenosyl-L-methionine-dependent methyltransferase [Parathielavia hyrcaniae]|uniref:S-adenosyl-L-methionine-dependent methyltransferase n=1 Tax=Parathielavia hyrcaniae TaxID=113614 RepID=A0AAN6Q6K7_9PEZI|nr:S-adenosyl-L-methionine-dependent methyltransferase [Parathielavia hyrcaniae]